MKQDEREEPEKRARDVERGRGIQIKHKKLKKSVNQKGRTTSSTEQLRASGKEKQEAKKREREKEQCSIN